MEDCTFREEAAEVAYKWASSICFKGDTQKTAFHVCAYFVASNGW